MIISSLYIAINGLAQIYNFKKMEYQWSTLSLHHEEISDFVINNLDNNDLVFTNLGDIYNPYHGEYGDAFPLLLTKSRNQFFLLTFYTDLYNYYDKNERKKIISLNKNVINGTVNPSNLMIDKKFKNFFSILHKNQSVSKNFKEIFSNEKFAIYKIN